MKPRKRGKKKKRMKTKRPSNTKRKNTRGQLGLLNTIHNGNSRGVIR